MDAAIRVKGMQWDTMGTKQTMSVFFVVFIYADWSKSYQWDVIYVGRDEIYNVKIKFKSKRNIIIFINFSIII